ncbi:MAG: hypothetical protein II919_05740 [Lachnospiraceae bacterium]|nr:hypothetical protein [Lachnospiraceae bacterium]
MKALSNFILNSKNVSKSTFIWNMVAAMSNSFQSMLLMLIITRSGNVTEASYIAIGFSIANLMMTIGKFGMRNYQVTDIKEKSSFSEYLYSRNITVITMTVCSVIYLAYSIFGKNYSFVKAVVVALICVYKIIESYEDVFHSRLQQIGRLDIASKIWAIRNCIFILMFFGLYLATGNIVMTVGIDVAVSFLLFVTLNVIPKEYYEKSKVNTKNVVSLLKGCIPIFVAAFLLMYISNAPKYIIDSAITDEEQTIFNILFLTIYVVTLLSNFVFNPVINKLAVMRAAKENKNLIGNINRLLAMVIGIVVLGIAFAQLIGRKILGMIYDVSLEDYKKELILMLISGGFLAIINLLYMVIIMLRKQNIFLAVFSIASMILFVFGKNILKSYHLKGLCFFYGGILSAIVIVLYIVSIYYINQGKEISND